MQNGERRTNYEQQHAAGDSAPLLALHRKIRGTTVMENPAPSFAPFGPRMLIHRQWKFVSRQLCSARTFVCWCRSRDLSVMENQEDGDPRSRPPGLGKPNEDGDGDGSCAQ